MKKPLNLEAFVLNAVIVVYYFLALAVVVADGDVVVSVALASTIGASPPLPCIVKASADASFTMIILASTHILNSSSLPYNQLINKPSA